jgi:hypothetical protein
MIPDPNFEPTLSITRAGEVLGMSPDASWRAAKDGFIAPLVQVSKHRKRVVTKPFLERLGLLEE